MEPQARCKKCGRVLKSPQSIAMGMGSTCAGETAAVGKSIHHRNRRVAAGPYAVVISNKTKNPLFSGDLSNKPYGRRETFCRTRDERRKLFEQRMPFQCGVLARTHIPVIYVPLGEGGWKENHSGRTIPHEKLQAYLKQYSLI